MTVRLPLTILEWADQQPNVLDGALLSIRECRLALGSPPNFNAVVLDLADRGVIALHYADLPDDAPDGVEDRYRRDHAGRPSRVIGFSLRGT